MYRFFEIVRIVAMGLVLTGCSVPPGVQAPVTIRSAWHGALAETAAAELTPGGMLEIRLQANAATGYGWQPDFSGNHGVLEPEEQEYRPSENGLCGAPGVAVWRLRAVKTGQAVLVFRYFRPWEKFDPAHDAMREVKITVNPGR